MTKLDQAIEYAQLGLRVLPLHYIDAAGQCSCGVGACTSPGKHPMTKTGVKSATTDEAMIRRWWGAKPDANIGIATGAESGVWVMDIDEKSDGYETLMKLIEKYGQLPSTWQVHTGGNGTHAYFRHPGGAVKNKVGVDKGIDIRGDGGYVVAPPSNHKSGVPYTWDVEPGFNDIADLPQAWSDALRDLGVFGQASVRAEGPYHSEPAPEVFPQGQRNRGLFELASSLRAKGLTETEILGALREANRTRCQPPLDDEEVRQIAGSAGRYERGKQLDIAQAVEQPAPAKAQPLRFMTGDEMMKAVMKEQTWIWGDRLSTGLALLAGAPKIGKSWMALALAMAVMRGEDYLGRPTTQGDVLYLALEDTARRIRDRSLQIDERGLPEKIAVAFDAPPIGQGLPQALNMWADTVENPRLVVIDTLGRVRTTSGKNESAYQYDTREMASLKTVADQRGFCILLIHHKRKASGSGDDIFDKINGTQGIFGAMDTTMLLDGKRLDAKLEDCKLTITGRDVEPDQIGLLFEDGVWRTTGRMRDEDSDVVKAMRSWQKDAGTIEWQGSASDLRLQLISYGLPTDVKPNAIGIQLSKYKFFLRARYDIVVEQLTRTSSRQWRITQKASVFEEIPTPDEAPPEIFNS